MSSRGSIKITITSTISLIAFATENFFILQGES